VWLADLECIFASFMFIYDIYLFWCPYQS